MTAGSHSFAFTSPLVVTANVKRYSWASTSGGLSTLQSGSLSISASGSVTGNYNIQYYQTVTSSPTGSGYVTVDSIAQTTPYQAWWDSGSSHIIAANSPVTIVSGQSQYIYSSWSDSGTQSHSVSPTAVTTYTASFQLQYYFSVTSVQDSPTGQGWYNAGTSISSTVTRPVAGPSNTRYETTGWTGTGSLSSGGSSGSSSTGSFTINAYTTCTWNWKTQYYQTVTSTHDTPSPASGTWYDSGPRLRRVSRPRLTRWVEHSTGALAGVVEPVESRLQAQLTP